MRRIRSSIVNSYKTKRFQKLLVYFYRTKNSNKFSLVLVYVDSLKLFAICELLSGYNLVNYRKKCSQNYIFDNKSLVLNTQNTYGEAATSSKALKNHLHSQHGFVLILSKNVFL